MDDTISKLAVIQIIEKMRARIAHNLERSVGRAMIEILDEVGEDVGKLPPVLGTNLAEVGTDLISRQQAIDIIEDFPHGDVWNVESMEEMIDRIKQLPSAESESFEWCTDCKEYDQEKHCCHRFTKVIRDAVAELKLVHCHECQYSEHDSVYGDRYCHYNGKAEIVDDYHFCRDGERREDG